MQSFLSWYKKPLTQDGLMPLHSFLLCLIVHSKFAWGDLPPPKHVVILDCVLANVFVMFWWVVLGILHTSCSLIFLCPTSSNCSCIAPTSLRGRFYWLWTVSTAAHIHNAVSHCSKRKQDMSNIYGHQEYPEVTMTCPSEAGVKRCVLDPKQFESTKNPTSPNQSWSSVKHLPLKSVFSFLRSVLHTFLSLLARFCLSPFAFFCLALQLWSLYTATPRKASLSSYRGLERNARSHWQGQSLAEKAGETLPFQNQGKQKNIQTIFKQYLSCF